MQAGLLKALMKAACRLIRAIRSIGDHFLRTIVRRKIADADGARRFVCPKGYIPLKDHPRPLGDRRRRRKLSWID
jgi:hypothetical protein